MGITDLFSSWKRSGLAALVAGGIACGDSGNSVFSEPARGWVTNDDCHGGRKCEAGQCRGELATPVETADLTFCCGRIIYSPDGISLNSLDVSSLESAPFDSSSEFKPNHFADLRLTSDFQNVVVSTHGGNNSQFPFYIFDVNERTFSSFSYISRGRQHSASGYYSFPHAQLLSDGGTIIAVLGDDFDGDEGELAIPRSQLYQVRENEIPQPLTSVANGIQFVQSHVVFPDDTIYFFGHTPEGKHYLFRTYANSSSIDLIPSSSELPKSVESMYRLTSGRILAKSFSPEDNLYVVDTESGNWLRLGLTAMPENMSHDGILVSPRKDQFIYQHLRGISSSIPVLYDLGTQQELRISQDNFPFCKDTACFEFESGVWLP